MSTQPNTLAVGAPEAAPAPSPIPEQPALGTSALRSITDLFKDPTPAPAATPVGAASPVAPPEPPVTEPPAEPPADAPPESSAEPQPRAADLSALIEEFRAQHPEASPTVLKRLADKEAHIRKQASDITRLLKQVKEKPPEQPPALADLERNIIGLTQPQVSPAAVPPPPAAGSQPPAQTAPPMPAPAAPPTQPPQIPDWLRTPETAYAELSTALAEGNFTHAHEVEEGIFGMRMQAIAPRIDQMIEQRARQIVQDSLGDVLPAMRETVEQSALSADREIALGQLEQGGQPLRQLFDPTSETPIKVGEYDFADTPANRIIAQNPWILNIQVQNPDRRTAARLTLMNRYAAIAQIARATGQLLTPAPNPATPAAGAEATPAPLPGTPLDASARQLFEAGREAERREQADRARQGFNAGPSTAPATSSDREDFVSRLGARRPASWADALR